MIAMASKEQFKAWVEEKTSSMDQQIDKLNFQINQAKDRSKEEMKLLRDEAVIERDSFSDKMNAALLSTTETFEEIQIEVDPVFDEISGKFKDSLGRCLIEIKDSLN